MARRRGLIGLKRAPTSTRPHLPVVGIQMAADSTPTRIALELDMGFDCGRNAQAAYLAGRTPTGDDALQRAWAAWERAKTLILNHEGEDLRFRHLALEGFLRGIEEKSHTTEFARPS